MSDNKNTIPGHTLRLSPDPECQECNGKGWRTVELEDTEIRTICGCLSCQIDVLPTETRLEIIAIDERILIPITLPKVFMRNSQN